MCTRDITTYPSVGNRCCELTACANCFLSRTGRSTYGILYSCPVCERVSTVSLQNINAIGIMLEKEKKPSD